ncbi:MAG: carboxymuconolactone decarboxylase family protein, partial [Acidaminococcaceae bacterium]|nr:carboxymuconolactone decarboxylase family protein [Acidaminococcaceae bacterium]
MTNQKKAPQKIVQTAGRAQLGEFAPDFARYNDDILFGEV